LVGLNGNCAGGSMQDEVKLELANDRQKLKTANVVNIFIKMILFLI
jgi:hypothetical protein